MVLYLTPPTVIDEQRKEEPETRKAAEKAMQSEWSAWMSKHRAMFVDIGAGVGKTRKVTSTGTSTARTDVTLYAVVRADSHAAASGPFESHPYLKIPQSAIEVIELNAMTTA